MEWGTHRGAAKAGGGEGCIPEGRRELWTEGSPARPCKLLRTSTKCPSPWYRGGCLFEGCNPSVRWRGSTTHRGACQTALPEVFIKTVIAATAIIERTVASFLQVGSPWGLPRTLAGLMPRLSWSDGLQLNLNVTYEYFKGCEWLQELMELHKGRARRSCFHLAKTLMTVLSGSANLRRRRCLWLALQISALPEQNRTCLWRMCRIYRSVLGSVPLSNVPSQGSIGHCAPIRCFPPHLLHLSAGQTASGSLLSRARLSPLTQATTHTRSLCLW